MSVDISIIIPTYNRLWSLPEAVESCRYSDCKVEFIVVDDGSTDGTWEWLQAQPDVRCFRQANQGKDWAVNFGVDRANGEWIRFLDSDDLLPPGANDRQLLAGRQGQVDVVVAGYVVWDSVHETRHPIAWTTCDDFIAQQLGECPSSHYSAYLFRRDFVAEVPHRPEYGPVDDRMFVIEVALKGPMLAICEEPCLIHRVHDQERLQKHRGLGRAAAHLQYLNILRRTARTLETRGDFNERRRKAVAKSVWPLAHWVAASFPDDARALAKWVRSLDPDFQPPEQGMLGASYAYFGFGATETLLSLRRLLLGRRNRTAPPSSVFDI